MAIPLKGIVAADAFDFAPLFGVATILGDVQERLHGLGILSDAQTLTKAQMKEFMKTETVGLAFIGEMRREKTGKPAVLSSEWYDTRGRRQAFRRGAVEHPGREKPRQSRLLHRLGRYLVAALVRYSSAAIWLCTYRRCLDSRRFFPKGKFHGKAN